MLTCVSLKAGMHGGKWRCCPSAFLVRGRLMQMPGTEIKRPGNPGKDATQHNQMFHYQMSLKLEKHHPVSKSLKKRFSSPLSVKLLSQAACDVSLVTLQC